MNDNLHVYRILSYKLGPFRVVHQTNQPIVIAKGSTVPIFCAVNKHSLKTTYRWSTLQGDKTSCNCLENTPILWIKEPGVYRCQVEKSNAMDICYSANITVKTEEGT